jgi:hypothetical protein
MLNDHRRNAAYEEAIDAACRHIVIDSFQDDDNATKKDDEDDDSTSLQRIRCLDIGAGTGLLAMMVARSLQKHLSSQARSVHKDNVSIHITSMEMSSAMARIAKKTIQDNGMQDVITVVEGHSCQLAPPASAHLCVSELLDSGLLGEGMLPAVRDAWQRHVVTERDAVVMVPQRVRAFAQLVRADWTATCRGAREVSALPESLRFTPNTDVLPVRAGQLLRDGRMAILSDPVEALSLSFARPEDVPGPEGQEQTVALQVTNAGTAHGALVWWEVHLWKDASYSTQPGAEPFQDHWQQCLHLLDTACELSPRQTVNLRVSHDDRSISVHLMPSSLALPDTPCQKQKRPRLEEEKPSGQMETLLVSPERAMQLNESRYASVWYHAIESALQQRGSDALVLDVSDFALCTCLAATAGAKRVISLESSCTGQHLAHMAARAIERIQQQRKSRDCRYEILQCHVEDLTLDLLGGSPVDVVVSEPYYEMLEGWHLQEALNYYYTLRFLRTRELLSPNAIVLPLLCRVMGCIIESEQLRSAYVACGNRLDGSSSSLVRGFDHSFVNQMCSFHEFDLSLPLWQYESTRLTDDVELGTLLFRSPTSPAVLRNISRAPFRKAGTCDALVVWLEYVFPTTGTETQYLRTDGPSHKQIVRRLKSPVQSIRPEDVGKAEVVCRSFFGGLDAHTDHDFDVKIELPAESTQNS